MTSPNIVFLVSSSILSFFSLIAFSLFLILAASFFLFSLNLLFSFYFFSFYLLFLLSSPNCSLSHNIFSILVHKMCPMLFLLLYLQTVVLLLCLGAVLICLVSL